MSEPVHIIVGAGHAGAHAAAEMRRTGFVGRIVLIGDEPHAPYERPPLSKNMLLVADAPPQWLLDAETIAELAIETRFGARVVAIDPVARTVTLAHGEVLGWDRLLLAVGGVARPLPVPGGEGALTLRSLDDALRLRRALAGAPRVAVVGAGVIGLEVASSAAALGCQVTVIEREAGPMARSATPEIQRFLDRIHRERGVSLHYGVEVAAIGDGEVVLADGSVVPTDVVVAGIGLAPNLDLARAAGLATDRGVLVDARGETSQPGIFAAGDVAQFWHPHHDRHLHWQTWQHAQNHARFVARAMAGEAGDYAPAAWFWSDQHGINLQFAGDPLSGEHTIMRGDPGGERFAAFHMRDGAIVGATFVNSGGMVRPTQALIAARTPVDPDLLGDPGVPMQKLVRQR